MSHCGAGLFKRLANGPGLVLKQPPSDPASGPDRQAEKKQEKKKQHILQAFKKNFTKIPTELRTVNTTLHLASQHLTHNATRRCESVSSRATTSSPVIPTQINVPFSTLKCKVDDENHLTLSGKTTNRSSVHFSLSQRSNSCFSCAWDAVGWTEESQYVYGSRWVHRRHTTEHIWLFFWVESCCKGETNCIGFKIWPNWFYVWIALFKEYGTFSSSSSFTFSNSVITGPSFHDCDKSQVNLSTGFLGVWKSFSSESFSFKPALSFQGWGNKPIPEDTKCNIRWLSWFSNEYAGLSNHQDYCICHVFFSILMTDR